VGYELRGRVFDKETGVMVAENIATAPDDPAKRFESGYSGFFAYSQYPLVPEVDVTWDNFSSVAVPEPGAGLFLLAAGGPVMLRRRRRGYRG
jgi:MYXO-CTERM domain-containing protein